jgi:nicotinic acid mononucleotide adenylyltransferase
MLSVKNFWEGKGGSVDSIIMSPSHDAYVLKKSFDIKDWVIGNRMSYLHKKISNYEMDENDRRLFSVDSWESLGCNRPVNFTDVIEKIKVDVERLTKKIVKIGYVFGSDNVKFAECFRYLEKKDKDTYFAFCVERVDYACELKESSNIFYIKSKISNVSSKKIREELALNKITDKGGDKPMAYVIRNDSDFALNHWKSKFPDRIDILEKSYSEFNLGLVSLFKEIMNVDVLNINLVEQYKLFDNFDKDNLINLDLCTNWLDGQIPLNYSRVFDINDSQFKPKMVKERLEHGNIKISTGDYTLVDDDICSGNTMRFVKEKLIQVGVSVVKEVSLLDIYLKNVGLDNINIIDVVDTRDFLIGSNGGGLVCNVNGDVIRVPYLFPWVNLSTRGGIGWDEQIKITKRLIDLSIVFFKKNDYIQISDFEYRVINLLVGEHVSIVDWLKLFREVLNE